jgi:putative nucleotidyltransferase with HDIG domain
MGLTATPNLTLMGDMSIVRKTRELVDGLTLPVAAYVTTVMIAAVATASALAAFGGETGNLAGVLGLAAVAALGEKERITLRRGLRISISLLPAIFAAALYGPLASMFVFAASVLGMSFPAASFPTVGRLSYASTRALTGAAAGGSAAIVFHLMSPGVGEVIAASTAAAFTAEVIDSAFASVMHQLRGYGSWTLAAKELLPVIVASVPLYSTAVSLLVLAYQHVSPWTLALFFAPALAAQRWFLLYQDQRRLADDLQVANDQLRAANLSFAKGLIATLDARDRYTAGHSAAVAIYARDIAVRMDLAEEDQQLAHLCGLVHDIGKIGLPAGLLEKPGALTLDERREMQRHSEIGERILTKVDTYAKIAAVVRHHERVDGHGYPDGIAGESIPLLSRIIAVADAYNAMTSDRPYRDAMPSRVARLRLAQAVETQFDTAVVAAFEAILAGAKEEYRLGASSEFDLTGLAPEGERAPVAAAAAALA